MAMEGSKPGITMIPSLPPGCHAEGDHRPVFSPPEGPFSAPRDADLELVDRRSGDREKSLPEVRLEDLQLRRPGRIVDLDDEPLPVETQRLDVSRDRLADRILPPAEHPTELTHRCVGAVVASARQIGGVLQQNDAFATG